MPDGDHVPTTIAALHADNKYVVCYISIGTWEVYRDDWGYDDGDDTNDFPDAAIGSILYDWPGEKWLDTTYVIDGETEPVSVGAPLREPSRSMVTGGAWWFFLDFTASSSPEH